MKNIFLFLKSKKLSFYKEDEQYSIHSTRTWVFIFLSFFIFLLLSTLFSVFVFLNLNKETFDSNAIIIDDASKNVNSEGLSKILKYFDDKKNNYDAILNSTKKEIDPSL